MQSTFDEIAAFEQRIESATTRAELLAVADEMIGPGSHDDDDRDDEALRENLSGFAESWLAEEMRREEMAEHSRGE